MALDSPRESDSDGADQVREQSIIVPPKLITVADSLPDNELSWLSGSHVPADLSIQVDDRTFHVHKYPLISKCGYVRRMDFHRVVSNFGYDFKLDNFPGGAETFQIVLRFCYGFPVDLSPENIASLRCASEYLEMTEEMDDGNLTSKTETFITFVVLSSWRDTIIVLKSCETLSPWSENLQIVRRCCDSIAWKVSRDSMLQDDETVAGDCSRFEEVATLCIDHFMRIITAIRARGTKPEVIGKCIMYYVESCLPGADLELEGLRGYSYGKSELQFSISPQREDAGGGGLSTAAREQRTALESLISILPPQLDAVPCKFLLKMLRMAILYSVTPALVSELEKRIGMVLEDANVHDLLIPCYRNHMDQEKLMNSSEPSTMHDIDAVQRILEYFIMHEQQQQPRSGKYNSVSKLLDGYLAAVARDPNLSIMKFQVLAESLPEKVRACDDGLYRAIDTYFKTHPSLSEHDRRRLCKTMNCEKLSLDACMHAAQNDRLPLRTIIQVLFSEQIKMRTAMKGKEPAMQSENNSPIQSATDSEIKTLRAELENVKTKMAELQTDYTELQQEYEKLSSKQKRVSGLVLSWRKIKNSFHVKLDGDDQVGFNGQPPSPAASRVGCRASFRRRLSVS